MSSFDFRLRFKLSSKAYIAETAEEVEVPDLQNGKSFVFTANPRAPLHKAQDIVAAGTGFSDMHEAQSFGERIRKSLLICCALLRMGVAVGRDEQIYLESELKETGENLLKDSYGLTVFPTREGINFVSITLGDSGGPDKQKFLRAFIKAYELTKQLTPRLVLAFELYNSSFFEASIRASFLGLISTTECLAQPERISGISSLQLDKLINITKEDFSVLTDPDQIKEGVYFLQRLQNLKTDSISSACRKLLNKYLDKDAVEIFDRSYVVRSKLLHEADAPNRADLDDLHPRLDDVVVRLLDKLVTEKTTY